MKYIIGDSVIVVSGSDKGSTGKVSKIIRKLNPQKKDNNPKVVIDGVNKKVKHKKAQRDSGTKGEIIEFFAPISVSNIAIVDPKEKKPSKIGYRLDDLGNKVRIARLSGSELPSSWEINKTPASVISAD